MTNLLFVFILLTLSSCQNSEDNIPELLLDEKEIILSAESESLVKSDNYFGLNLFRKLASENTDNMMISPLSISQALLMTYNGADGETKKAFEDVLHLNNLSIDEVNKSAKILIDELLTLDPSVDFLLANSIWYKDGYAIKPEFLDVNNEYYSAQINQLVFNDAAVQEINNWVDINTKGKIAEIINEIDPSTLMFLINATYFKGNWKYQFDKKDTYKSSFYAETGDIECDFMQRKLHANVYNGDSLSLLELPYGRGNFQMVILLPNNEYSVQDILQGLHSENLSRWLANSSEIKDLNVNIPKFKFEYEKKLNDVLIDLGLGNAFSPGQADFSKIIDGTGLFISEVKHKTFVEVNEEGTEAAAVTSVAIELTAIIEDQYFTVNRPFVFAIREKYTNSILFIGKVENPLQK